MSHRPDVIRVRKQGRLTEQRILASVLVGAIPDKVVTLETGAMPSSAMRARLAHHILTSLGVADSG